MIDYQQRISGATAALAVGLFFWSASPGLAQETSTEKSTLEIEEVTVTARRVEERMQEVPVAVSAFTEDMLQQRSATNVGDIAGFVPNLYKGTGPTAGSDGYYYIRGVGQFDPNAAVDPGVGTYLDGIYLGRTMGASFDTLDIARVEVLRGPQGTLFGRNTMGGAINVVTSDPGEAFGAKAKITVGSRNRIDGQVSVDLPVTERFKLKLSALTRNQDGWGRRASDGATFGDIKTLAGRIKALWEPADNLTVRVSLDATDSGGSPAHKILIGYQPPPSSFLPLPTTPLGVPFPLPGTPFDFTPFVFSQQNPGIGFYDNNTSLPTKDSLDVWGSSGTIDWDVAGIHVKSITAYRELKQNSPQDYDSTPYSFYEGAFIMNQNQFSQELQFRGTFMQERVDWMLGLYYYDENVFYDNQVCLGGNNGLPPFAPGFAILTGRTNCLQNRQDYNLDTQSWAMFTHVNIHLTDRITAVAGVRYTDETKKYAFDDSIDNTAGVFSFFGFPPMVIPTMSPNNPFLTVSPSAKHSWDAWTPKLGLNFQATNNMLLYFSYSEGFKSGGYNGRQSPNILTGQYDPLTPFEPETITTNEFGIKSEWFDHRMRLNATVFSSNYDNIQLLVVDPTSGFFNQINAAEARINGFEIELLAKPLAQLELTANIGYAKGKYRKLDPVLAFSGITKDDPLVNTPLWTMNYSAQYTFLRGIWGGSLALRIDYVYIDDLCFGAACSSLDLQNGYGLVNLRSTWTSSDGHVSVSAFGLNVTDKEYFTTTQDVIAQGLGVAFGYPGRPTEWGLEVAYRY